jgi:hypothetical protein
MESILARGRSAGHVEDDVRAPEPETRVVPAHREADTPVAADATVRPAPADPIVAAPVRRRMSRGARLLESSSETGPLIPITTRLPVELDDWLEMEVFNRRRAGIRKQDLIAAGLRLLREDMSGQD